MIQLSFGPTFTLVDGLNGVIGTYLRLENAKLALNEMYENKRITSEEND